MKYTFLALIFAALAGLVWVWEKLFTRDNTLVIYFGRPRDVLTYVSNTWDYLFWASLYCLQTAIIALLLAGVVAIVLLTIGLLNDGWLQRMELLAACSQAIPFLVIVTMFLLLERAVFKSLNINPGMMREDVRRNSNA